MMLHSVCHHLYLQNEIDLDWKIILKEKAIFAAYKYLVKHKIYEYDDLYRVGVLKLI